MSRKKPAAPTEPELARGTKIANLRASGRLIDKVEKGGERVMLNVRSTGPKQTTREPIEGMTDQQLTMRLADAMGTTSPEFIDAMLVNLLTVFDAPTDRRATREINAALAVLDGMKPENEVEAMLVTQMVATNDAAMRCLAAIGKGLNPEMWSNMSVKLLRTFTGQAEALAKLRRKGEQTVRVVHVHPGGQAVVGDVHNHRGAGGGGQHSENWGQSDAADNPVERETLPSPNQIGETVPVPSSRRPEAVPHARRDKSRRSDG